MFERESGDFDPERDEPLGDAAEEAAEQPYVEPPYIGPPSDEAVVLPDVEPVDEYDPDAIREYRPDVLYGDPTDTSDVAPQAPAAGTPELPPLDLPAVSEPVDLPNLGAPEYDGQGQPAPEPDLGAGLAPEPEPPHAVPPVSAPAPDAEPEPPASGATSPATPAVGNRPADQAVVTDSAAQVGIDWTASDAATDFLGLDDAVFVDESLQAEFTPPTAETAPPTEPAVAELAPSPAALPVDPSSDAGQEGPLAAAPEGPPDGVDPESWLMDGDAEAVGEGDPEGELELAEQLEASYSEPDTKGRLLHWVVRGTAAAAVLAVCVTLVKLYTTTDEVAPAEPPAPIQPTRTPVARNDGLSLPAADAGDGATVAADDGSAAVLREGTDGAPDVGRPADTGFDAALQGQTTAEVIDQAIRDSQGTESVAADVGGEVPLDENGQPIGLDALDPTGDALGVRDPFDDVALNDAPGGATETPGASLEPGPVVLGGDLSGPAVGEELREGALRYASADELASLWDGTSIPLDAVDSEARVVTPNVGRVRAVLYSGQVFEGRLYAVGEGRIWLDNGLGRMALAGSSVTSVEHVLSSDGAPGLGDPGSDKYSGLPRVRARAPGGVFFGRLIHRDGDRVILITEEGARLTLEGAEVDPAPSTKRVVVVGYEDGRATQ